MGGKRERTIALGLAAGSIGLLGAARSLLKEPAPEAGAAPKAEPTVAKHRAGGAPVSSEWDLPVERNERVDFFIEFLSGEKREKMHLWLERLGRYAPMIHEELRARGMPEDLVFLAMMESGLDNDAYSSADAAGMWQFIEETGERYGLEVSEYVDERRDPVKATRAALDYLEELHDRFGSWYLAAAAYNTGENRVERILRERAGGAKGDEALYWKISPHIPRETRDYVPLMLAAGHIGKDPSAHGFTDLRYMDPLAYEEVVVAGGVPLERVAEAAGVEADAVAELNRHLVKGQTPPGRDWTVRVPQGTARLAAANLGGAGGSVAYTD